jgi:hypothetical protein
MLGSARLQPLSCRILIEEGKSASNDLSQVIQDSDGLMVFLLE